MVAPICGQFQSKEELACRCAKFITNCLNSSNCIITLVVRHGVFHRIRSPIGRNAKHCSSQFGETVNQLAKLINMLLVSISLISVTHAIWLSGIDVSTVTQLLDVKHNYATVMRLIL